MTSHNSSGNNSQASCGSGGPGGATSGTQVTTMVDRLKLLYPNVNETVDPLPRSWSPQDKCTTIGLTQNNLRVHYKGFYKFYYLLIADEAPLSSFPLTDWVLIYHLKWYELYFLLRLLILIINFCMFRLFFHYEVN